MKTLGLVVRGLEKVQNVYDLNDFGEVAKNRKKVRLKEKLKSKPYQGNHITDK